MDMDDDPWSNWGKALAIVPKRPLPEEADPNSSSQTGVDLIDPRSTHSFPEQADLSSNQAGVEFLPEQADLSSNQTCVGTVHCEPIHFISEEAELSSSQTCVEPVHCEPTHSISEEAESSSSQTRVEPVHREPTHPISEEAESSSSQTDSESDLEFVDAMPTQPVPVRGQAVYVDGEYWDICVKYGNTGKIFLLVKNFENVKAPGILKQEAEATARCEGVLEDEDEGLFWPSLDPLVKKGCYIFYPKREKDGIEVMVEKLVGGLAWAFTAPVRAFTTPAAPIASKRA